MASSTINYRVLLQEVYESFAPEKLTNIDKVLDHFKGREDKLIKVLEEKYSICVHSDGAFDTCSEASTTGSVSNVDGKADESDFETNSQGNVCLESTGNLTEDGVEEAATSDEEKSEGAHLHQNTSMPLKPSAHVAPDEMDSLSHSDDESGSHVDYSEYDDENNSNHGNSPQKLSQRKVLPDLTLSSKEVSTVTASSRAGKYGKGNKIVKPSQLDSCTAVGDKLTNVDEKDDSYAFISPSASTASPGPFGSEDRKTKIFVNDTPPSPPPYPPPTPSPFVMSPEPENSPVNRFRHNNNSESQEEDIQTIDDSEQSDVEEFVTRKNEINGNRTHGEEEAPQTNKHAPCEYVANLEESGDDKSIRSRGRSTSRQSEAEIFKVLGHDEQFKANSKERSKRSYEGSSKKDGGKRSKKFKKEKKKKHKRDPKLLRTRSRSKPRLPAPASPRKGSSLFLNPPKRRMRRVKIDKITSNGIQSTNERNAQQTTTTSVRFAKHHTTIGYSEPIVRGRSTKVGFSDKDFFCCWLLPLFGLALSWILQELAMVLLFSSSSFAQLVQVPNPPKSYWLPEYPVPHRVLDIPYLEENSKILAKQRPQGNVVPVPNTFHTSRGSLTMSSSVWTSGIPQFQVEWMKESSVLLADSPTFDNAGNLYISPLNLCAGCTWGSPDGIPRVINGYRASDDQGVALISLDAVTGERRWTLPGRGLSLASPLILDAAEGEQLVFQQPQRNRVVAMTTDGDLIWESVGFLPDVLHAPGSPATTMGTMSGARPKMQSKQPTPDLHPETTDESSDSNSLADDTQYMVVYKQPHKFTKKQTDIEEPDAEVGYGEHGDQFADAIRKKGKKKLFNFGRHEVGGFTGPFDASEDHIRANHVANGAWSRLEGDYVQSSLMYLAKSDALVGVTFDGIVFALDRKDGVPLAKPRKLSCNIFRDPNHGLDGISSKARQQLLEISRRYLGRRDMAGGRTAAHSGIEDTFAELEAAYEELDLLFGIYPLGQDGWDNGLLASLFKKDVEEGISNWSEVSLLLQGVSAFRSCVHGHFSVDSSAGTLFILSSYRKPTTRDGYPSAFEKAWEKEGDYWGHDKPASQVSNDGSILYKVKLVDDDADSETPLRIQVTHSKELEQPCRPNMHFVLNGDKSVGYLARSPNVVEAFNSDSLQVLWTIRMVEEVIAPVSVVTEGDTDEIYAITRHYLVKIAHGAIQWQTEFSALFQSGAGFLVSDVVCEQRSPPTVTSSGVVMPIAAVRVLKGVQITIQNALVYVDRSAGTIRFASDAPEDTVGPVSVSPRGEYATSNLPHLRSLSRGMFGQKRVPLVGGVTKYKTTKLDLHIRDISCLMLSIAQNASRKLGGWTVPKEAHEEALVAALQLEDLHYQSTAAFSQLLVEQEQGSQVLENGIESKVLHHMDKIKRALLPLSQSQRKLCGHFRRHDSYMMATVVDSAYAMCSLWR